MLKYLEYMDYESVDGLVDIVHRCSQHNHITRHVKLFHQDRTHADNPVVLVSRDSHIHQTLDANVKTLIIIEDTIAFAD